MLTDGQETREGEEEEIGDASRNRVCMAMELKITIREEGVGD